MLDMPRDWLRYGCLRPLLKLKDLIGDLPFACQ